MPWRDSRVKRLEAAAIAAAGYRAIAALGATLTWKTEGREHFEIKSAQLPNAGALVELTDETERGV